MQNWIVDVVREMGPLGVGLLMFLENVFPPIPSELIMPLAGYLSMQGQMAFGPVVAAGVAGSLAGALFWYRVGRTVTYDRLCDWVEAHGVWLAMTPEDIDRAVDWFDKHGRLGVFFGRLLPVVRTLISVPAGFSRMRLPPFLLLTSLGTALWTGALAYMGRLLGKQFHKAEQFIGPVSWVVVGVLVVWYLFRVVQIRTSQSP